MSKLARLIQTLWAKPRLAVWLYPLLPLSWCYRWVVTLRRCLYQHNCLRTWRAPVPIVVVGNLYVGGTGKTPLTLALVELLQQQGWHPGIVARGYGAASGRGAFPQLVLPESETEAVGDEPLLMARRRNCPVVVHPQRVKAVEYLLAQQPQVNIVVCDDGLQHLTLQRDLEIAVFDQRGIGNGRCLPAGPLREAPQVAQQFAIWACNAAIPPQIAKPQALLLPFQLQPTALRSVANQKVFTLAELAGKRIFLFAGIGAPERFFASIQGILEQAQAAAWRMQAFPDHHPYSQQELQNCLRNAGVDLAICTEKDAVKCQKFASKLPVPVLYLAVDAALDPASVPALLHKLEELRQVAGMQALERSSQAIR